MRFKKGSTVEVMKKTDMPISWRLAEILSGNGHTYSVRYHCHPGLVNESGFERVSRKCVRPCPPSTQGKVTWIVGDLVEVCEDLSWKTATILKDLQGDNYFVRLLGTSSELTVHKLNIRGRLLWLDDKWILMGKVWEFSLEFIGSLLFYFRESIYLHLYLIYHTIDTSLLNCFTHTPSPKILLFNYFYLLPLKYK